MYCVFIIPAVVFLLLSDNRSLSAFVLYLNIGFVAICIAAFLSQNNAVGCFRLYPISYNNPLIQMISQVVKAIALYSDSAEDLETVTCFFVFQEIKDFPSLITT